MDANNKSFAQPSRPGERYNLSIGIIRAESTEGARMDLEYSQPPDRLREAGRQTLEDRVPPLEMPTGETGR